MAQSRLSGTKAQILNILARDLSSVTMAWLDLSSDTMLKSNVPNSISKHALKDERHNPIILSQCVIRLFF